jgi:nucleotide-binding universal stress UspA family protein
MFRKILFATTASPDCGHAAKAATQLARRYGARLLIFHVFGMPSHGHSPFVVDLKTGETENKFDQEYTAWTREEIRSIYAEEIRQVKDVTIDCAVGVPYREILRKARNEDVDAIVMGSHTCLPPGESTRLRNVVGNTMQSVAKNARCPVFVISKPCRTCLSESSTIICATDFSKASLSAFTFAASMARDIGSRLLIFHSVDITPRHFGQLEPQESIEKKIKAARQRIEQEYLPLLEGVNACEIHVWEGFPLIELLKFTREQEANLLVMAHHNSEKHYEEGPMGSMVEQVVLRSTCPLVSVNKPMPEKKAGLWLMDRVLSN